MAWSSVVCRTITLVLFSGLILAAGFSLPFWVSFQQKSADDVKLYGVYTGIWYVMICRDSNPESCNTKLIEPDISNNTDIRFSFYVEDTETAAALGAKMLGNLNVVKHNLCALLNSFIIK